MSVVSARFISMAHAQHANIPAMIASYYLENVAIIFTCTVSWNGSNRSLHEGNVPCAVNLLNGLTRTTNLRAKSSEATHIVNSHGTIMEAGQKCS